ncbi:hypothetical protein PCL_02552 [Purpureocillium lilacinum]|uniref:Uncharacterized protein n=1 Tax=Purpureocillium lilacinum TaxID=33203 RepID=A0A2U3E0V7_PURLI|nr:hypothetical protein PCL_02552 [Purpureocillium lilacinum]
MLLTIVDATPARLDRGVFFVRLLFFRSSSAASSWQWTGSWMRSGSGRGVRRTPPSWFIPTPLPLPLPSSPHVSHPSIQPSTHTPIQPIPRTPITGQASLAPGRQNLIAYPTTAFNWAAGSTSALPTLESPLAVNAEGEKRHGPSVSSLFELPQTFGARYFVACGQADPAEVPTSVGGSRSCPVRLLLWRRQAGPQQHPLHLQWVGVNFQLVIWAEVPYHHGGSHGALGGPAQPSPAHEVGGPAQPSPAAAPPVNHLPYQLGTGTHPAGGGSSSSTTTSGTSRPPRAITAASISHLPPHAHSHSQGCPPLHPPSPITHRPSPTYHPPPSTTTTTTTPSDTWSRGSTGPWLVLVHPPPATVPLHRPGPSPLLCSRSPIHSSSRPLHSLPRLVLGAPAPLSAAINFPHNHQPSRLPPPRLASTPTRPPEPPPSARPRRSRRHFRSLQPRHPSPFLPPPSPLVGDPGFSHGHHRPGAPPARAIPQPNGDDHGSATTTDITTDAARPPTSANTCDGHCTSTPAACRMVPITRSFHIGSSGTAAPSAPSLHQNHRPLASSVSSGCSTPLTSIDIEFASSCPTAA